MTIGVTIDTRGIDRSKIDLVKIDQVVRLFAASVVQNAKNSMIGLKSGIVYPRGKRASHQASAPGEPPAMDTGNLSSNISLRPADIGMTEIYIRDDAAYGYALELGAPSRKLAARPFLRPALAAVEAPFTAAIKRLVEGMGR